MASIAPIRSPYDKHRVAPLPRIGGLLLVLLVIAAGIAPIIPWGDATSGDTEISPALTETSSPKDTGPLSIFNGFDATAVTAAPAGTTPATDGAVAAEPAVP